MSWKDYPQAKARGDENGNVEELIGDVYHQTKSAGADNVRTFQGSGQNAYIRNINGVTTYQQVLLPNGVTELAVYVTDDGGAAVAPNIFGIVVIDAPNDPTAQAMIFAGVATPPSDAAGNANFWKIPVSGLVAAGAAIGPYVQKIPIAYPGLQNGNIHIKASDESTGLDFFIVAS